MFIIFRLYILFLRDIVGGNVQNLENGRFLMDYWLVVGIIAVTTLSTSIGTFGVMVEDRSKNILKNFSSSPLSKKSLLSGDILSSVIISTLVQ